MPKDSSATRRTLLDAAAAVVMERGFGGASTDLILERAGVSRGTLFYHFSTKDELSRTLIERHAIDDKAMTNEFMSRAERLVTDPLQQLLVFIGLYVDMLEQTTDRLPGCLFASYAYEAGLFDEETNRVVLGAIDHWRAVVGKKIHQVLERHPPVVSVDADTLADLGYTVFEGGMILSRVRGDARVLPEHLRQYRRYVELLFDAAEGDDSRDAQGRRTGS